jgi:hypothetical protein
VAAVVSHVCGIQAQDTLAAALSVRARTSGVTHKDVQRALEDSRSIVRTWAMRGTLHWLAAEDVGWLVALLGRRFQAANARRRDQLGLDQETTRRGVRLLEAFVAEHGPSTRDEIVAHLAARGLELRGQARPHLIAYAAQAGRVCYGPERGREPTYVLVDDWLPGGRADARSHGAALGELARRYLRAFAPLQAEDFAAWSGLAVSDARAAWASIERDLLQVDVEGQTMWGLRGRGAAPDGGGSGAEELGGTRADRLHDGGAAIVRLLPAFDTYLLGYRRRDLAVAAEFGRRVNAGGGMVRPTDASSARGGSSVGAGAARSRSSRSRRWRGTSRTRWRTKSTTSGGSSRCRYRLTADS